MEHVGDELLVEPGFAAFGEQRGVDLVLHRVHRRIALLLGGDLVGGAQFGLGDLGDRLLDFRLVWQGDVARLLGGALGEADDGVDHRLEAGVARHDRREHCLFRKLLGFRFDHQNRVGGAGHDEIEVGGLGFLDGRIHLQRAIDIGDARRQPDP